MSVMDFLERVTELRKARGYSEDELYRSSLDLFAGKALLWYRSAIRKCSRWQDLADLLKKHYLPPDYRSRLFQELLNRTQGPDEPIVEYLACVQALVDRYGNMSRSVHLDIVRRNLAPFYTMQLPPVHSMEELEAECLLLETKKYRAEHYRAPPSRNSGAVEPGLACLATGTATAEVAPNLAARPTDRPSRSTGPRLCWVCNRPGHLARDCRQRPSSNSGNAAGRV